MIYFFKKIKIVLTKKEKTNKQITFLHHQQHTTVKKTNQIDQNHHQIKNKFPNLKTQIPKVRWKLNLG
jgi:hypothetical protein